jgi:serine/threonine-protein kinase
MGSVWLAERVDGLLKRPVALKLPHPGLASRAFGERLARERDILASLAHPHIARLYDAGLTLQASPTSRWRTCKGRP